MKRTRSSNSSHCFAGFLTLFVLVSGNASLAFGYEQITEPKSAQVALNNPGASYASFEQYHQTLDDLFEIAFMIPRYDEEGGLNKMIISLNQKIVENPEDVDSLVTLGHLYRILKQPSEANYFYQRAVAIESNEPHLHCFSALMLYQVGEYNEAINELNTSLEVDPVDVHAWLARGRAYARIGKFESAINDFEVALKLMPENQEARMLLGQLYAKKGDADEAYEIFEALSSEDMENRVARFNLAIMKLRNNEKKAAIKILEDMFLKGVRDLDFMSQLSIAYMDNEDYDKALKILDVLKFLFPEKNNLDFLLAEAHRNLKHFNKAIQLYRMIIVAKPDYVDGYIGLAVTFVEKGSSVEALKVLKGALRHMPGNERLLKWEERISKNYENV